LRGEGGRRAGILREMKKRGRKKREEEGEERKEEEKISEYSIDRQPKNPHNRL
jgi:hypothetical protein